MRSIRLVSFLGPWIAIATLAGAAPSDTVRAARVINQEYRYAPPTEAPASPVPEPEIEAVQMEAFTVTEAMTRRDLERKFRQQDAEREAERFKPLTGGKFRSVRLAGLQGDLGLWSLLEERELAHLKGQDLFLKVDFLRLKW